MLVQKPAHKTNTFRVVIFIVALIIVWAAALGGYLFISNQQIVQKGKQTENARISTTKAIAAAIAKKEAKKKEPVYITLPGAKTIRAIVDDYSQTSSIWAIVSKTHPIPTDYVPASLKIPDVATRTDKSDAERSIRSDIETPMKNMFDAATADGYQLMIGSGYRSAALQAVYFNSLANSVGETAANQSIARPGQSEHQTGLAADISTVSRNCYISDCFAETDEGQWLVKNSYKYGFTLRYPKDKVTITGYQYEPWHFRYVGIDLATALHDSGLTLDEAWPYLQKADATLKSNGAIN
jgi:D-alanyl-D-alanine carboxypeptidase